MFPTDKVEKVVVFLPQLSVCRFTHFCPSTFLKMSLQFVPPPVPPLPKIDHLGQKKGEPASSPEQPKIIPKIPPKSSPAYNIIRTLSEHPENCVLSPHSSPVDTSSIAISNRRTPLCFSAFRNIHTPISPSSSAPLSDLAIIPLPPAYKPHVNPM